MESRMLCPVCSSKNIYVFLKRNHVPVHQNFIFKDAKTARDIGNGNLELTICHDCSFIFNSAFEPEKLHYGDLYDNTQISSHFFKAYVDDIINFIVENYDIINKNIVEVGCGKGTFLTDLIERAGGHGYGFDPSYVGPENVLGGKVVFKKCFYGLDCTDIPADLVVCRHVIEHVQDPVGLLINIRKALIDSPHAVVFFETPCVDWILTNKVSYDFFYEHCSYFNYKSLTKAFEEAGFIVEKSVPAFNDQYMWFIARVAPKVDSCQYRVYNTLELAQAYTLKEQCIIDKWKNVISGFRKERKAAIWGAGAKGATFLNLVDINASCIDCVIDINPNKQGCFLAGTGHPIVGYGDIIKRGITDIIIMNSNYEDEIYSILKQNAITVNVLKLEGLNS